MNKTCATRFVSLLSLAALAAMSSTSALASSSDVARLQHRLGVYAGFLGDPFPTLAGVNLGFNATSWLRLVGGYGSISATVSDVSGAQDTLSATTLGGGVRLFLPDSSFSPVIGLSYANVSITSTGTVGDQTVGGFGASAGHLYTSAGIDWQTHYGLNLGVGYNYSLKSGVGGLPFINLGWFF